MFIGTGYAKVVGTGAAFEERKVRREDERGGEQRVGVHAAMGPGQSASLRYEIKPVQSRHREKEKISDTT